MFATSSSAVRFALIVKLAESSLVVVDEFIVLSHREDVTLLPVIDWAAPLKRLLIKPECLICPVRIMPYYFTPDEIRPNGHKPRICVPLMPWWME